MKRTVLWLGSLTVMVLVFGLAAQAAVLYEEDFGKPLAGYQGKYETGGSSEQGAGKDSWKTADGWLDSGNGDGPISLVYWVTGNPTWSDVAVSSRMRVNGQNTGWAAIFIRLKDSKNYYALRYTTGSTQVLAGDVAVTGSPDVRLEKVVDGQVTVLAETSSGVPAISADGDRNAVGAVFQLVAKGNTLKVLVDGKEVLSAKDGTFLAGRVGFGQQEYSPLWDYIKVETH